MELKVSILIPTYNAGSKWIETLDSINKQTLRFHQKIVVDSGSSDNTVEQARANGFEVISIPQKEFNHGRTRQLLADKAIGADIALFVTQDAIMDSADSASALLSAFNDEMVGMAYGRQLPHLNATPLETHARYFNYPEAPYVRQFEDKERFGFKTIFCSNSFAAYRINALHAVGGFPTDSIMGEDTIVAARLLKVGHKVAYMANATVRHSHDYTFTQEFKRFFDTRVFHEQNPWLFELYGKPTSEGVRYIKSEVKYALKHNPILIVKIFSSVLGKWLGYQAGKYYDTMPKKWLRKASMHSFFWK